MGNSEAYKDWTQLFDNCVYDKWKQEQDDFLKPLAMLLFVVKREMKSILDGIDENYAKLKHSIREKHLSANDIKEPVEITEENKENIPMQENILEDRIRICENLTIDSPEIFNEDKSNNLQNSPSIIISDDDDIANTGIIDENLNTSPEVKKKRRFNFSTKFKSRRDSSTPSPTTLEALMNEKTNIIFEKDKSPIKEESSIDFLNPKINIGKTGIKYNTPNRKNRKSVESLDDTSVVQCTPINQKLVQSRRKEKLIHYISRKKQRNEKSSTITQMFSSHRKENRRPQIPNESKITESEKQLNALVNCFGKATDTEASTSKESGMEVDSEPEDFLQRCDDIQPGNPNFRGKKKLTDEERLNEYLAKAQRISEREADEGVVRGKARKKLPGWACKDCARFYLAQGMTPKEMLALNKCSRHRSNFKPREETIPGFWDMDMNTPDCQENNT